MDNRCGYGTDLGTASMERGFGEVRGREGCGGFRDIKKSRLPTPGNRDLIFMLNYSSL